MKTIHLSFSLLLLGTSLLSALDCPVEAQTKGAANGSAQVLALGLKEYKQKNYRAAAAYFEKYLSTASPDPGVTYYLAISTLQAGNLARAKQVFEYIESIFPESKQAELAKVALTRWGGSPAQVAAEAPSSSAASPSTSESSRNSKDNRLVLSDEEYKAEFTRLPKECRIPLRLGGTLEAQMDGRTMRCRLGRDWETRIGVEDLKRAGIAAPNGPPDDSEINALTKKKSSVWKIAMTIKLGEITRKVPVTVMQDHDSMPEIGHAFLEDLQYEFDQSSAHVILRKKSETVAQGAQASQAEYKAEFTRLPDESQIRFTSGEHGHMLVDAYVDGHSVQCQFDTGASAYFGVSNLRQANIPVPSGKPDSYASGWAGHPVPIWKMTVNVKIGNMTRRIPISVSEEWTQLPLIGQDFVRDYQYSIDRAAGRMELHKKTIESASNSINSLYDVPCKFEHERDYVTLEVQGRQCEVLIDTGASNTILSLSTAQSLGIEIPAGARRVAMSGVGGAFFLTQVAADVRLGPVIKKDFPILIGGSGGSAIGQDFMAGWRFTVDRNKHLLRFFH